MKNQTILCIIYGDGRETFTVYNSTIAKFEAVK